VWNHILAGWSSELGTRPRFVAVIDAYVLPPPVLRFLAASSSAVYLVHGA
jgi:hypothetical protein